MKKGVHLIIPMAGRGSRFLENGISTPKPLINLHNKPFFYWSVESLYGKIKIESLTFVVLREHVEKYNINNHIYNQYPNSRVVILNHVTDGPITSVLAALDFIADDLPIVVNDCDHRFACENFYNFCNNRCDDSVSGILLTFKSDEARYSYIESDSLGNVLRTAEKNRISNNAICGCYFFTSKQIILDALPIYYKNCTYNEYFVSGIYNVIISQGKKVIYFNTETHISFGTPEEYIIATNLIF